jgi:hypothetical protein
VELDGADPAVATASAKSAPPSQTPKNRSKNWEVAELAIRCAM